MWRRSIRIFSISLSTRSVLRFNKPLLSSSYSSSSTTATPPPKLEGRYLLAFTCKRCQHQQQKHLSKQAYHHGVVIVRCDGCSNLHLIADNLGWFRDNPVNIETLLKEKGEELVVKLSSQDLLDLADDSHNK